MIYHAHIYWSNVTPDQRIWALHLRSLLRKLGCEIGKPHDVPIGPHPMPMFQAIYNSDNQSIVESMLSDQRNNLTVLLHENTNNDIRDHTEGARWLGTPLTLDLEWLANNPGGE